MLLDELRARATFGVTELEGFADCSSIWFIERVISPRTIDGEVDARLRGSIAHQTLYKFFSGVPKRLGIERLDAERLDDGLVFLRECLAEAIESGVWLELSRPRAPRARGEPAGATSSTTCATRRSRRSASCRGGSRSRSAPSARRPSSRAASRSTASRSRGRSTGSTSTRSARAGSSRTTSPGRRPLGGARSSRSCKLQIPLYMLVLRDLVGIEPLGGLYRALAGERQARGLLRAEAEEDVPGFARKDYLDEEAFWAPDRAGEGARGPFRRAHPLRRRAARSEGRLSVPDVVRSVVDVPGGEVVTVVEETRTPNEEQLAAIDAGGLVFVSAGAGTGKTTVLVERFVAGGLRSRPAASTRSSRSRTPSGPPASCAAGSAQRLAELGRHDLARELDGAWISTIHGFCHRLLKAHPFEAGHRPALPRARREPVAGAAPARRSRRRSRRSARPATRSGSGCSRRIARAGCGGC